VVTGGPDDPRAVGKRVRGALYVHRDVIGLLRADEQAKVERAVWLAGPFAWNVVRLESEVVGLLCYPDFESVGFPHLEASARVDLAKGTVRLTNFAGSANPLILHRKELLVSRDHPAYATWAKVTERAEQAGLFRDPGTIGRQQAWNALLAGAHIDQNGEPLG
jgi:hypothetical protein